MALRLYLDDCANHHRLRELLISPPHSHDVETPFDAQIVGCDDDVHLAYARDHNRILITKNPADFIALHDADRRHPGICVVYQDNQPSDMTAADVVEAIGNLIAAYAESGLTLAEQVHILNNWRY